MTENQRLSALLAAKRLSRFESTANGFTHCEQLHFATFSVESLNAGKQSTLQIISAGEEHLPAIAELAGVIWRACYPGIISHAQIDYMLARMYALDTMRAEIQSQGIHYKLLLIGGKPAGFASYGATVGTPRRPESFRGTAQRAVPTFKLHKLYLLPELQGRGLGSRLLQHCEQLVRSAGARRLVLSVNKRNAKAIAAYKRNGFVITESVVTDIGGGFVMDDYIMVKELNPDVLQRQDAKTQR